jgi:hypothetical protein
MVTSALVKMAKTSRPQTAPVALAPKYVPPKVLLLHCCYTVVTLFLHCCYTVVTLLFHCCYTVVTQGGG